MVCPKCGTDAGDEYFCPNCGNFLIDIEAGLNSEGYEDLDSDEMPVETEVPDYSAEPQAAADDDFDITYDDISSSSDDQAAPAAAPKKKKASVNAGAVFAGIAAKVRKSLKGKDMRKVLPLAAGILAAIIIIFVIIGAAASNSYKKPVKTEIKYLKQLITDSSNFSYTDFLVDTGNSLYTSDVKGIIKLYDKSSSDMSSLTSPDMGTPQYDGKIKKYKITNQEELDQATLNSYTHDFRDTLIRINDAVDTIEEDETNYDNFITKTGLEDKDAKKLLKKYDSIAKNFGDLEVTEGYKLTVTITIKGAKGTENTEQEVEMIVLKVNGRWISEDYFSMLSTFINL